MKPRYDSPPISCLSLTFYFPVILLLSELRRSTLLRTVEMIRESEQLVKVALTIQVTRRGSIAIQQWVLDQTARRSSVKKSNAHYSKPKCLFKSAPDLGLIAYSIRRLFPSCKEGQRVRF